MVDAGLAIAPMTCQAIPQFADRTVIIARDVPFNYDDYPPVPMDLSPEEHLELLLHRRRQHPHRMELIDAEIETRFLQTRAILILDMSGLTATTQEQGIIPALQRVYHLRAIVEPILADRGGRLLKAEADNVYGVFERPDQALWAATDMLDQLQENDLSASIGIGYGEVLAIGPGNLYGNQMNLTSRLGEDLAAANEILLTESAHAALEANQWQFEARQAAFNGEELFFYKMVDRCSL